MFVSVLVVVEVKLQSPVYLKLSGSEEPQEETTVFARKYYSMKVRVLLGLQDPQSELADLVQPLLRNLEQLLHDNR